MAYVVGKAGRQHWQHVYTAVTRGRSRVYVIAQESELRSAIRKRSFPRKTRLKHFLQKQLSSAHCASPADFPSQPSSPGLGGTPSTQPPASPLYRTPDSRAAADSSGGEASPAPKERFTFDDGWLSASSNDMDTDEESAKPRGSKRTGAGFPGDDESPSKFRMVGVMFRCVHGSFRSCHLQWAWTGLVYFRRGIPVPSGPQDGWCPASSQVALGARSFLIHHWGMNWLVIPIACSPSFSYTPLSGVLTQFLWVKAHCAVSGLLRLLGLD